MTHTPGPWSFEQIGVTDAGPNHDDVFDIGPCDREGAMRKRIATVVGDDARLIAAAPELLSVLVQAIEASGHSVSGPTDSRAAEHGEPAWVCNARAVISKATS
jgi:hypothetical protein